MQRNSPDSAFYTSKGWDCKRGLPHLASKVGHEFDSLNVHLWRRRLRRSEACPHHHIQSALHSFQMQAVAGIKILSCRLPGLPTDKEF